MRDRPYQNRKRNKLGLKYAWLTALLFLLWVFALPVQADQPRDAAVEKIEQILASDSTQEKYQDLTGSDIITEVFRRHKIFPYVYEGQTMILMDSMNNKDVRKLRRFSRVDNDSTMKYLLVFDYPEEVKGLALRFIRDPNGAVENQIYLPALGKKISLGNPKGQVSHLLGTDFSLEDLIEFQSDFHYTRIPDQTIAKVAHFVVDAFPLNNKKKNPSGYSKRRLFVRQDIFFIVRTDYFDRGNRFVKQLTHHDLKKVGNVMWRANMLLMENKEHQHSTLIKINQRIFSRDYVHPEIFNPSWLQDDHKIQEIQNQVSENHIGD